ncbi:hypothetical protein ACPPVQ_08415 [Diaminobutyricibacter sp. McL0618]|uniref:hypothetical protein n=1 Tax=Leifsonia sp. McL0618 TaxID=3415677 RepID=UPI003CF77DCF
MPPADDPLLPPDVAARNAAKLLRTRPAATFTECTAAIFDQVGIVLGVTGIRWARSRAAQPTKADAAILRIARLVISAAIGAAPASAEPDESTAPDVAAGNAAKLLRGWPVATFTECTAAIFDQVGIVLGVTGIRWARSRAAQPTKADAAILRIALLVISAEPESAESAEPESAEPESAEPESAEPESAEPESAGPWMTDLPPLYPQPFHAINPTDLPDVPTFPTDPADLYRMRRLGYFPANEYHPKTDWRDTRMNRLFVPPP